jgi:hypothetical protein
VATTLDVALIGRGGFFEAAPAPFGKPRLFGERIGTEYQISRVTPSLGVFADSPDEIENGWIAAAFRRERPDAACS